MYAAIQQIYPMEVDMPFNKESKPGINWGSLCDIITHQFDSNVIVCEFKLVFTFGKGMNPFMLPAIG